MMNRYFLAWIMVLGICSVSGWAQDHPVIDLETLRKTERFDPIAGYVLNEGWRYQSGDNPLWALPEWDDREWPKMTDGFLDSLGWQGLGWFRYHFRIAPDLNQIPLSLFVIQVGASEIYLDGHLIGKFGKIGYDIDTEKQYTITGLTDLLPLQLSSQFEHVLAVRFSNFRSTDQAFIQMHMPLGFHFVMAVQDFGLRWQEHVFRMVTIHEILFAVPLSLSLLHLLLFVLGGRNREDVYYALLTASIAGIVFAPLEVTFVRQINLALALYILFKISLASCGILGLWFVYHFFGGTTTWFYKTMAVLGGALILFSFVLGTEVYYFFCLLTYPEAVRVIFLAVAQKRQGAFIVGVGLLAFIAGCVCQILLELNLINNHNILFPYVYGSLVFMLAMSIYLARNFAQTHYNLERQLGQIKELSSLALAQERDARRLELQAQQNEEKRHLLEVENALMEREIEEAQQRQALVLALQQRNLELETAQSKLVQSEKMASLGNLVAGIAHEINTPVGAINSMHDTLIRAVDRMTTTLESQFADTLQENRAMRAALKVIQDANVVIANGTSRVTEIVRSLRSFARLDEAEMKETNLQEGIENTLTLVHHDLKNRIEVKKEFGTIPTIMGYPSRLNQVFLNLLVNAIQAIQGKGRIVIRTRRVDQWVEIDIEDSGQGISDDYIQKIFDPGFTTKGVGVGTGLGLSICYQIVQDHRGEIRVKSREGEGTRFTVVLPV